MSIESEIIKQLVVDSMGYLDKEKISKKLLPTVEKQLVEGVQEHLNEALYDIIYEVVQDKKFKESLKAKVFQVFNL